MTATTYNSLSEYLKEERSRQGLTQVQLAVLAGVSLNTVADFEQGKPWSASNVKTLRKIIGALGGEINLVVVHKDREERFRG